MKLLGTKLAELEPGPVKDYFSKLLEEEYLPEERYLVEDETFQYNFGGDPLMVETLEDLKEISSDGETSLFDGAIDLDVAELLTPDLCMICIITNNSGGNTYFINKPQFTQSLLDSLYKFNQDKS